MKIKTTQDIFNDIMNEELKPDVRWIRVSDVRKYFDGELKENSQKLIMNLLLKELK